MCDRKRWSLQEWMALNPTEAEIWLKYEQRRQQWLDDWYERLVREKKHTAEVVTLIELARKGGL